MLATLLVLFLCRAVLVSAIVPPWQGPDEPNHFALAWLLASKVDAAPLVPLSDGRLVDKVERDTQRRILESMARHRFWDPYGLATPDPLPTSFPQLPSSLGVGTYAQPLYYGLGAAVLRMTQPGDLEAAYWHLRVLSIFLGAAALVLGWAGTRLLFGPMVAAGATTIAVFLPQFLLTAITVNPDALVNVWGAFAWWQVARVIKGRRPEMSLVLLVVAAGAALLTKRNAIPLAISVVAVAGLCLLHSNALRLTRRKALLSALAIGAAVILVGGKWLFASPSSELARLWTQALIVRRAWNDVTLAEAFEHARVSIDSAWLIAGWLRFPAPEAWLLVARGLTLIGLAGAAVMAFRSPALKRPLSIAWLFVIIQAVIVIGASFWTDNTPQGRYLFPVLAPAMVLLWMGLTYAVPASVRQYAVPIVLTVLAAMDVTAFTTVLLPAYLL